MTDLPPYEVHALSKGDARDRAAKATEYSRTRAAEGPAFAGERATGPGMEHPETAGLGRPCGNHIVESAAGLSCGATSLEAAARRHDEDGQRDKREQPQQHHAALVLL